MRQLLVLITLLTCPLALATEPPEGYPLVNGLIRKIDADANRISVKHEDIPNLNMPGMTMSFVVSDPTQLNGVKVGDKILFVADEVDGELVILWLEIAPPPEVGSANILCKGVASTTPKTKVEIEIRPERFSTIRYEFAEGSLKGTAYVNSIGQMKLQRHLDSFSYLAGLGKLDAKLVFKMADNQFIDAHFYHYSAGMDNAPVECSWEN